VRDPETGCAAAVDSCAGAEERALVVASRELKQYTSRIAFFTNEIYGNDMAQNVTFGGAPENVHNGTDNAYWTGSALSGTWTFDSAAQVHAGAKSVDATATVNGNTAQFAKGGSLSLSGYVALTGWIYLSAWDDRGTKDINLELWSTAQVGVTIGLRDYIDVNTVGAWQKFVVTVQDFDAVGQTITTMRVTTVDLLAGAPPDYYLDDIQFEETGSPIQYTIEPEKGTWFYVDRMRLTMADNVASTVADGTLQGLAYNAFLGVSALTNGILYQRIQGGEVALSNLAKQLSDYAVFPNTQISAVGDGTNTMLMIDMPFAYPEILRAENDDRIRITVRDDLSGLLLFETTVSGRVEQRG